MAAYGLYTHIASNKFRSMLLLAGLFVLIYVLVYAGVQCQVDVLPGEEAHLLAQVDRCDVNDRNDFGDHLVGRNGFGRRGWDCACRSNDQERDADDQCQCRAKAGFGPAPLAGQHAP